jgi:hypothetical protein
MRRRINAGWFAAARRALQIYTYGHHQAIDALPIVEECRQASGAGRVAVQPLLPIARLAGGLGSKKFGDRLIEQLFVSARTWVLRYHGSPHVVFAHKFAQSLQSSSEQTCHRYVRPLESRGDFRR